MNIKLRRMRLRGHVTCIGEMHKEFWSENPKKKSPRHRLENYIERDIK
jgi:hypothetical protein